MTKVKFNNILKIEEKIRKEFDIINKSASTTHCVISEEYLNLKLEQLKVYYEYQVKLQEEKEEQRFIKEQMKEEERVRKEAEKARLEAEKEEKIYEEALEKAKNELSLASEEERQVLNNTIFELQEKLKLAQESKERAKSMAEQTKRGHVYIISNIGSFGENVYKIGMTRRLEPLDRVKELSSAAVPFDFDVHTIIPSEDAPSLENKLHKMFNNFRVNKVNEKKEYFKVKIDDLESALKNENIEYKLTKIAEAKDYRESLMLVQKYGTNN